MSREYAPLTKLRVKSFQSIEDTELELGGLTVLVGPGDAGKSAILRALRAALLNEGEDDDIRHGASRCEVALDFEDGMSILWWKEKGKGGCYAMTGGNHKPQEFTKTGGAVPDAVAEYLGIGRIEVDSTTELTPQLSDQHDQPFIIWESGSKRARILGKATRLDVVVTAQMACKKQLDTHRREAERAARELEEVTGQLASLPDVKALEHRLNEVEKTRALVVAAYALASRARELRDKLAEGRFRAQAVDTSGARDRIAWGVTRLAMADLLVQLREKQQESRELDSLSIEVHTRREQAHADYTAACQEAGVCSRCGGLRDHTACAVL